MRILLTGGGTGGHIYPALAYYRYVKKVYPDAQFLYIGTEQGLEQKIVTREGIPFQSIEISGLKRKLSFENVKTLYRFVTAIGKSKALIRDFKPDVVIGTGGYVCAPVVYAAHKLGVATVIHEQNSVAGITNRFLSRYSDRVAICFDMVRPQFPEHKVVLTGNPRATEVSTLPRREGKPRIEQLGLNPLKRTVVITSGSRGARPVNEALFAMFKAGMCPSANMIWITGDVHYDKVMADAAQFRSIEHLKIVPYMEDMPSLLQEADIIVSRAGATILAEITALGKPSILIPSPYVTANHQEKNAESLNKEGACVMILESELTSERLYNEIVTLTNDDHAYESMQAHSFDLGIRDASERLHKVVQSAVMKKGGNVK
ncbi:MAG: undecaprenyldiphospho-muramoylpentapeptide beta-N-acetylglucosaminyltransferase [Bacilli bacterium]